MSEARWCNVCGGYISSLRFSWERPHECAPLWETRVDGGGWRKVVRARSEEDAAEEAAKRYNEDGDYSMMDEEPRIIEVRTPGDEESVKRFSVRAEPTIEYHAEEMDEDHPNA